MNILFIHQNFPGQFEHLAPALVSRGHAVSALTIRKESNSYLGLIRIFTYKPARNSSLAIHPWLIDFETKIIRAEAVYKLASELKLNGYEPDIIYAHPGWGESLFIKYVWPRSKLLLYSEYYYQSNGADVGFDPEFPSDHLSDCRIRIKNTNNLVHFEFADAGLSPTHWQKSTFPELFRSKISVTHDGIDTERLKPDSSVSLKIDFPNKSSLLVNHKSEVLTFINRNLEPYRGYHIFMRSLPKILSERPNLEVLVIGGDGVSYGSPPDKTRYSEKSWKEIFFREIYDQLKSCEINRVNFLGNIPYSLFIQVLQLSTVHVYLTYPFVLSWSMLEAMSVGCAVIGSRTAPVEEVITHGDNGLLVDFFDHEALSETVCYLLDEPSIRQKLGKAARQTIIQRYDLKSICLPAQVKWVEQFAHPSQRKL